MSNETKSWEEVAREAIVNAEAAERRANDLEDENRRLRQLTAQMGEVIGGRIVLMEVTPPRERNGVSRVSILVSGDTVDEGHARMLAGGLRTLGFVSKEPEIVGREHAPCSE